MVSWQRHPICLSTLLMYVNWISCSIILTFFFPPPLFFFPDLLVDMLGVLASYSITVKELKLFFSKLQGEKGQWVSQMMLSRAYLRRMCWEGVGRALSSPASPDQCPCHTDVIARDVGPEDLFHFSLALLGPVQCDAADIRSDQTVHLLRLVCRIHCIDAGVSHHSISLPDKPFCATNKMK